MQKARQIGGDNAVFDSGGNSSDKSSDGGEYVEVGYGYNNNVKFGIYSGPVTINQINRLGLHFNLAAITGKSVFSAMLVLIPAGGKGPVNVPLCARYLGVAKEKFWEGNHWHDPNNFPPANQDGRVSAKKSVDVTSQVRGWLAAGQAMTNYGFILSGASEDENANTQASCLMRYADRNGTQLIITYTE